MKKTILIALIFVLALTFTTCGGGDDDDGGGGGGGGGKGNLQKWTAVSDSKFGTSAIYAIAYGNNRFVAVGWDGKTAYSDDGENWTYVSNNGRWQGIAYGNNRFVAVSDFNAIAYSADGESWTKVSVNSSYGSIELYGIAYGNNKFVAVGAYKQGNYYSGIIMYSTNGTSWTDVSDTTFGTSGWFSDSSNTTINAIAYGNNRFVAVGVDGKMAYSDDGETWTAVSNSTFGTSSISAIAYGNNRFVAASGSRSAYSEDGVTWKSGADSGVPVAAIAYGGGRFVAVGYLGKMAYSTNGTSWTAVTDSTIWQNGTYSDGSQRYSDIRAIAYGNNRFVAVSSSGKMAYADW